MTGRAWLSRRVRWVVGAMILTAGIGIGSLWLNQPAVGVASFVTFHVLAVAGRFFLLPCPWCRANLGHLIFKSEWWCWGVDPAAGYCPRCGTDLDDDVPDTTPADEPDRHTIRD